MDKQTLIAYRDRWKAVEEIERQEQRAASLDRRWRQINDLFNLAISLDLPVHQDQEEIVWQRWAKLKAIYES
jgi:hypothetical protein